MNKNTQLFCLALAVYCFGLSGQVLANDNILAEVDSIRSPSSSFSFDIHLMAPNKKPLKMSVRVKDHAKSLVRYLEPARSAGRAILFVERNMWIYVPGSRRALRISPRQQIMSGVASADIARTVYSLDYQVDSVEPLVTKNGEQRRRLVLSRKSKGAAYARIDLIIGGEEARPLRAEFYASHRDFILKTAYFENYSDVLGKQRPTVLRVVDHMSSDTQTTINYSNYQLEETPDRYFQPAYLKRLR